VELAEASLLRILDEALPAPDAFRGGKGTDRTSGAPHERGRPCDVASCLLLDFGRAPPADVPALLCSRNSQRPRR